MRLRPSSRAIIAGASFVVGGLMAPGKFARADEILLGSSLIPTSTVVSSSSYFPTSYIPTSYVVPTSSVFATSAIVPTSSILETSSYSYLPTTSYVTSYRTGGLFRRRLIERTSYYSSPTTFLTPTAYTPTSYIVPTSTYLPTSYIPTSYVVPSSTYVPTSYVSRRYITPTSYLMDDGLVPTSVAMAVPSSVCTESDPSPVASPTQTRQIAPRPADAASNPGNTIYSRTREAAPAAPVERMPSAQARPDAGVEDAAGPLPPPASPKPEPAPIPDRKADPTSPPANDTRPSTGVAPAIPAPGEIGQPKSDEMTSRTSYRPVTYSTRPSSRNVLRGRVVSFDTGRPEEAVRVILASRSGNFEDRQTQTDADGEFKISLPDGDWVVKVAMPSNSVYTVGRTMTASAGRVVDPNGKKVGELVITR